MKVTPELGELQDQLVPSDMDLLLLDRSAQLEVLDPREALVLPGPLDQREIQVVKELQVKI